MDSTDRTEPEQLLASARAGGDAALGRLLEMYRRYVRLLAELGIDERFKAKVDASDLVQETFLDAHRDFANFRGTTERELMAWLKQILAGNLADHVTRRYGAQKRDIQLEHSLHQQLDRSSFAIDQGLVLAGATPSQSAARREQAVVLADALGQLPENYREVLVLRHLKGLKFPDVARHMRRSVGSTQQLWARAVAELRRRIGDDS